MLHIKLRELKMQQHSSKYFAHGPPPPPSALGMMSVGQNSTFLEHGHFVYQIKENHDCSNTVANILPERPLPPPPPPDPGDGVRRSKYTFFRT